MAAPHAPGRARPSAKKAAKQRRAALAAAAAAAAAARASDDDVVDSDDYMVDSADPDYVPFVKRMSSGQRRIALSSPANVQYLVELRDCCDAMGKPESWMILPVFNALPPPAAGSTTAGAMPAAAACDSQVGEPA